MKTLDSRIKKKILAARRRITVCSLVKNMLSGLVIGLAAAALIMIVSLFVPMYYAPVFAVAVTAVGFFSGLIFTLVLRPDMRRAALLLDAKGFKERVITSYERCGSSDTFSELLKEDTLRRLDAFDIGKAFAFQVPRAHLAAFLCMALLVMIVGLIDTPAKQQADKDHALAMEIKKESEEIADAIEKVKQEAGLSDEALARLTDMEQDAIEALKEAEDIEDIEKAKERLEKKLEQEVTDLLTEQLLDALEAAKEGTLDMSEEELEALSEALSDAAANMTDEELAGALLNAADSLSVEDLEAALAALSNAQQNTTDEALDGSISLAAGGFKSGAQMDGEASGISAEDGEAGSASGTGNTKADGSGGGWYEGSKYGSSSQETYSGDYVSVPENVQDNENLTGTPTDGESYTSKGGESVTWDGVRIDYQQVIGEYETKAYERISGGNYPSDVQDAIRTYFESLNQ